MDKALIFRFVGQKTTAESVLVVNMQIDSEILNKDNRRTAGCHTIHHQMPSDSENDVIRHNFCEGIPILPNPENHFPLQSFLWVQTKFDG